MPIPKSRTKEEKSDGTYRYDVVRGAVHHLEQLEDESRRIVAPFISLGRRRAGGGGTLGGGSAAHAGSVRALSCSVRLECGGENDDGAWHFCFCAGFSTRWSGQVRMVKFSH